MHHRNPLIIEFANLIGRTPSSVTFKLVNLASFDPSLKERGIKGTTNAGKLTKKFGMNFINIGKIHKPLKQFFQD